MENNPGLIAYNESLRIYQDTCAVMDAERSQGSAEGRAEGIQEGIIIGELRGVKITAKRMLQKGADLDPASKKWQSLGRLRSRDFSQAEDRAMRASRPMKLGEKHRPETDKGNFLPSEAFFDPSLNLGEMATRPDL